jgi:luciferase family oxidoreductase group 1
MTARALRRERIGSDHEFPQDVVELQSYFREEPPQPVRAVPGAGLRVPIWLLGSSRFSAQLAAMLGLPYAFASHFAPDYLAAALHDYRNGFRPSEQQQAPYAMVGVNVVAADTDTEAQHLFTSMQVQSADMFRGQRDPIGPPIDDIEAYWTAEEKPAVMHKLSYSIVGSPDTVRQRLSSLIEETGADELITTVRIFEPSKCLRSLEILAGVRDQIAAG